MRLRDWVPADMPALLDLWQAAWQPVMPTIDFVARRPGFAEHLLGLVAAGVRLRVATAGDALIGFYTLDAEGYLDQLAVRRDMQGRGVARALIDEAKALSPGQVALKVNQANTRAIAFYERQGFRRGAADVSPHSGLPLWHYVWQVPSPQVPSPRRPA